MRPKKPSDVQDVLLDVDVGVGVGLILEWSCVLLGGSSPSRHPPNQPGYLHDDVDVGRDDVVVTVGAGAGVVVV